MLHHGLSTGSNHGVVNEQHHADEQTKNMEKIIANEKAELSEIPFVQKVKEMEISQRRSIGALYACASASWYRKYPKVYAKLMESLHLSKHDEEDVTSVAESSGRLSK